MWLALLFAAMDDATVAGQRRAATHEMARRLGVPWGVEAALRPLPDVRGGPLRIFLRAIEQCFEALRPGTRQAVDHEVHDWLERLSRIALSLRVIGPTSYPRDVAIVADCVEYRRSLPPPKETFPAIRAWKASTSITEGSEPNIHLSYPDMRAILEQRPFDEGWRPTNELWAWALREILEGEPGRSGFLAGLTAPDSPDRHTMLWLATIQTYGALLRAEGASLCDWFEQTHPDLRRFTLTQALDASHAWHQAQAAQAAAAARAQGGAVQFRHPIPPRALEVLRYPDGWTLVRLVDRTDYAQEGIAMGHCVGGESDADHPPDGDSRYYRQDRDGTAVTFSLRSPTGVPEATIEVRLGAPGVFHSILQIQGPLDRAVQGLDARVHLADALDRLGVRDGVLENRSKPGFLTLLAGNGEERLGMNQEGSRWRGPWSLSELDRWDRTATAARLALLEATPRRSEDLATIRDAVKDAVTGIARRLGVERTVSWVLSVWEPTRRFNADRVERLRGALAAAADAEVQAWNPDPETGDAELGRGGACDRVCAAMEAVLARVFGDEAELEVGGHDGDDHVYTIVHFRDGARVGVDVPAHVYETGGGYRWTKKPGARVTPADVDIGWIDPPTRRMDGKVLSLESVGVILGLKQLRLHVEMRSSAPFWRVPEAATTEAEGETLLGALAAALKVKLVRDPLPEPVWFPTAPGLTQPVDAYLPRPALLARIRPSPPRRVS